MLKLENPKVLPNKLTPTLLKAQQLPHIEKVDSKDEIPCLKWTIYNGGRKVRTIFQTDTNVRQ